MYIHIHNTYTYIRTHTYIHTHTLYIYNYTRKSTTCLPVNICKLFGVCAMLSPSVTVQTPAPLDPPTPITTVGLGVVVTHSQRGNQPHEHRRHHHQSGSAGRTTRTGDLSLAPTSDPSSHINTTNVIVVRNKHQSLYRSLRYPKSKISEV